MIFFLNKALLFVFYRVKFVRPLMRWLFTDFFESDMVAFGENYQRVGFVGIRWRLFDVHNSDYNINFRAGVELPFDNESVGKVYCSHFLEHLTKEDLNAFLKERQGS